jgi:uncharacterized membrane protein YdjX (TVP38/TMEM64 family)
LDGGFEKTPKVATYYAGRLLRRETVKRLAGERLDDLSKQARSHGLAAVTAVRLVPAAPFGGQIAAALEDPSTINWWIVVGVAVAFVALTYFVRRWFARQES